MSLDIRHLTNGEKTVFVVYNKGVDPSTIEIFNNREDIDVRIRHYAPTGEPVFCGPDLARMLGVLDLFYPNHPNCIMEKYSHKKCIAESCRFKDGCEIGQKFKGMD